LGGDQNRLEERIDQRELQSDSSAPWAETPSVDGLAGQQLGVLRGWCEALYQAEAKPLLDESGTPMGVDGMDVLFESAPSTGR